MEKIYKTLDELIEMEVKKIANDRNNSIDYTNVINLIAIRNEVYGEETKRKEVDKNGNEHLLVTNLAKNAIEIAGIVLPLIFYGRMLKQGWKFEQTGIITSSMFKGLLTKIRPTK